MKVSEVSVHVVVSAEMSAAYSTRSLSVAAGSALAILGMFSSENAFLAATFLVVRMVIVDEKIEKFRIRDL